MPTATKPKTSRRKKKAANPKSPKSAAGEERPITPPKGYYQVPATFGKPSADDESISIPLRIPLTALDARTAMSHLHFNQDVAVHLLGDPNRPDDDLAKQTIMAGAITREIVGVGAIGGLSFGKKQISATLRLVEDGAGPDRVFDSARKLARRKGWLWYTP